MEIEVTDDVKTPEDYPNKIIKKMFMDCINVEMYKVCIWNFLRVETDSLEIQ